MRLMVGDTDGTPILNGITSQAPIALQDQSNTMFPVHATQDSISLRLVFVRSFVE